MPMVDVSVLKEWVENWFYMNRNYHPYSKSNNIPIPELYDILERMPSVDVVRCGECEWCQYDEIYGQRWCDGRRVKPDHYCGYGKRRKGGDT